MTDIWDELDAIIPVDYNGALWYDVVEMDAWLEKVREQLREAWAQSRVNGQHRMLYQGQRDEAREKLEAIKNHWYNEVPPFTMPFLDCRDEVVQKYIEDMTEWGRKLGELLGGYSEFTTDSELTSDTE